MHVGTVSGNFSLVESEYRLMQDRLCSSSPTKHAVGFIWASAFSRILPVILGHLEDPLLPEIWLFERLFERLQNKLFVPKIHPGMFP